MRRVAAEPHRDLDFSRGRHGPVIRPEPGKTKISIRLDNRVLEHFRSIVEAAGGGNYQTLINDALLGYIQQKSMLEAVRQVVREEVKRTGGERRNTGRSRRSKGANAAPQQTSATRG